MRKKAYAKKANQQRQQPIQQQDHQQQQQQQLEQRQAVSELSSFTLAAAIEEARSNSFSAPTSSLNQPRKIFSVPTLPKNANSQQSLATNTSFATANDETPVVSYFADSSDEDDSAFYENKDPLTILSRTSSTPTNTEIIFSKNPEETTMSQKVTKLSPVAATAVPIEKDMSQTPVTGKNEEGSPHFDVAQHLYSHAKGAWGWGKSVPIIASVLGVTEAIATKLLNTALKMDLPALDEKVAQPNLKKLDDDIVTPAILAIWNVIGPAVHKGDEMVVKPIVQEVVPKILGSLGMGEGKKQEEKVDNSPNPEYTTAPMIN